MGSKILVGDCLTSLRSLEAQSVQTCVTSPPYFGLRDYGHPGQIGLEATPDAYVAKMVEVFREVRRVLRDDGTCWINLGDSYASGGRKSRDPGQSKIHPAFVGDAFQDGLRPADPPGIKPKDLLGTPWRVAFALQADGWYLRQDIIWHKPNPMPESVRDRCTKAHEYIFMLSKSARYYYDADAIAEPLASTSIDRLTQANLANQKGSDRVPGKTNGNMKAVAKQDGHGRRHAGFNQRYFGSDKPYTGQSTKDFTAGGAQDASATKARIVDRILSGEITTRNKRSVWTVTTKPFKGAHFATFPPDLIEPCILAGCPVGGTVLDPFGGAGTTGMVAQRHGRNAILCELNPEYAAMAEARIAADAKKTLESLL
jgi:DNA modification methylase